MVFTTLITVPINKTMQTTDTDVDSSSMQITSQNGQESASATVVVISSAATYAPPQSSLLLGVIVMFAIMQLSCTLGFLDFTTVVP
jgi:hypothetical protein